MTAVLEEKLQTGQLQEQIAGLQSENQFLGDHNKLLAEAADRFQAECEQLRYENQQLQNQIASDTDQGLELLEAENLSLQQSLDQTAKERDELKEALEGLHLGELQGHLEQLTAERDSIKLRLQARDKTIDSQADIIGKLEKECIENHRKANDLGMELHSYKLKNEKLYQKISDLESDLNKAWTSNGGSKESVEEIAKRGEIIKDLMQENIKLKEHIQLMAEKSPLADLKEWARCQTATNYVRIKEAQSLLRYWDESSSETAGAAQIRIKTSGQVTKGTITKVISFLDLLKQDFGIDSTEAGDEIARQIASKFSEKGLEKYIVLPDGDRKAVFEYSEAESELITTKQINKVLAIRSVQNHPSIPNFAKQHMNGLSGNQKAIYAAKLNQAVKAIGSMPDPSLAEDVLKGCDLCNPSFMKHAVENVKNIAKIANSRPVTRGASFESISQGNSKKLAEVTQAVASQKKAAVSLAAARIKATGKINELFVATDAKSPEQRKLINELEAEIKDGDRILVSTDEKSGTRTYIQLSLFQEASAPTPGNSKDASDAKQPKKPRGSKATPRKSKASVA
ncbi:MAG: hypothetical protein F6J93_27835 [Oscillatoria sp. SIO1A7]|nr:hypothetical protein [Oscillatoria sp. SIO1A7]